MNINKIDFILKKLLILVSILVRNLCLKMLVVML
jgi:hypothetical protein